MNHTSANIFDDDRDHAGVLNWVLCFALILGLHIGIGWIVLHRMPHAAPPPSPPPEAVIIDLAPLPAAPPVPSNQIAPGPKQTISQPPPKPMIQPPPLVAPPSPAPQIAIPLPPKPPPRPPQRHRLVERLQPPRQLPDKTPPAPATTAPPQLQAPPASNAVAPMPGVSSAVPSNDVPNWQALLLARLKQSLRYPYEAQADQEEGVVYLHFTMNRQGKVLSANIAKSSGFGALDREALALVYRAEPLPIPPTDIPGDPIDLTVPVQFFLHQ